MTQNEIIVLYGGLGVFLAMTIVFIIRDIARKIEKKKELKAKREARIIKLQEHKIWQENWHKQFTSICDDWKTVKKSKK